MASVQTQELTSTDRGVNGRRVQPRRSEKGHHLSLTNHSDPSRIPKTCKSDDGSARPKQLDAHLKKRPLQKLTYYLLNLLAYKVLTPIQVITLAYQEVMDTITKCLRLFAEDQQ